MHRFEYGSYAYEYYVEFSDRRTLTLVVQPNMKIVVRAPRDASLNEIEAFLKRKWRWLEKQLKELRRYRKSHREKQFVSGESFYYLGRQYMLVVKGSSRNVVKLERGKVYIYTTNDTRNSVWNKKLFEEWLNNQRKRVFKREFVAAYNKFNYESIPRLKIRTMAKRWGSCSADGRTISLNPKLIETPREAVQYVCIHELCHVTNKKHDEVFYKTMNKMLPGWREVKDRLEIRHG